MKKGQLAMELLMTYGWAIMVVIVVISVLMYLQVLRPEQFLLEKCILPTTSGLFCKGFTASASFDTITLRFHNFLTKSVDIISISTDNPACSTSTCDIDPIPPDSIANCELSCAGGLNSKDKIRATIFINHKIGEYGLEKIGTGTLSTTVP